MLPTLRIPPALSVVFCVFACFASPSLAQTATSFLPSIDPVRPLQTADDVRGWEAVGRLDTGVSFCSGTLITPDLVLTAAHCLFSEDGERYDDADLQFAASLRNGRAEAVGTVARSYVPETYTGRVGRPSFETVSDDLALLELAQPINSVNVTPITTGSRGQVEDLVTVVSYGRDREAYASIEENCEILASDNPVQVLSCHVVSGSSGAPILRESGAGVEVIAVVSAVGQWQGEEATIAVSVDRILPDLLAAYQAGNEGMLSRMPGTIRLINSENSGRDTIGARFLRP